ncbi:MAG: CoA transferase [Chloroflexi bacterium]|nr:CoA transferase [Chloroflexota bacterium]
MGRAFSGGTTMARLPLHGIRVLDFTVVWAGPWASMLLGDLGAEVIRVEGPTRLPGRRFRPFPDSTPGPQ